MKILTSFVYSPLETSLWSPLLLNVQWKAATGGLASTRHRNVTVSCFSAPYISSRSWMHTGASANNVHSEVSYSSTTIRGDVLNVTRRKQKVTRIEKSAEPQ